MLLHILLYSYYSILYKPTSDLIIIISLLGVDYFQNHLNERIRNCGGFVFIKAMYAEKFLQEVEQLRSKFENKTD